MRLVEQPMPQSYHLQDNGWTPLSQNPCWHWWYSPWPMFVYNDNPRVNIICKNNVHVGQVKSFVDDLKGTGYCKHESSLCATICWGSALVPAICARHKRWKQRENCTHPCVPVTHSSDSTLSVVAISPPPSSSHKPLSQQSEDTTQPFPPHTTCCHNAKGKVTGHASSIEAQRLVWLLLYVCHTKPKPKYTST